MWFAVAFGVLCGALSLYFSPRAADLQRSLFEQAKGEAQVAGIQPGAFREFGGGDRVVYVESIADDGLSVGNVFVRVTRGREQHLLVAEQAFPAVEGPEGDRYIVLENGRRYTGKPGRRDFVTTDFERHAIRLEQSSGPGANRLEAMSTLALLGAQGTAGMAELQWRASLPISVPVLVLMAVSLARTSPRQGRYAKLVTAFVLYFLYNNGIGIAQKLIERGDLSPAVGVWPVHVAFALLGVLMLAHQTSLGWRVPWPRRRREAPGDAPAS
jgi:lipopolysaccharide export system permease protein